MRVSSKSITSQLLSIQCETSYNKMIKVLELIVLSLAVVCSVTCLSVQPAVVAIDENEVRSPVDDSIRNLLENLRYSLRCGFPEQGIPPLAPFHIKSAELNERGLLYK